MSKHMYFSLDSNVLSNLAELSEFLEVNPNATDEEISKNFSSSKSNTVAKDLDAYKNMLAIAKDKSSPMRFLITATPWDESCHIPTVKKFVKKYCYTPDVKYLKHGRTLNKIERLASKYCKKYKNAKGEIVDAPMTAKHIAAVSYKTGNPLSPDNDAYIMAEATVYGACLITENLKHFIHENYEEITKDNGKTYRVGDRKRFTGIVEINTKEGYEIKHESGYHTVPKPWAVDNLGRFLDNLEDFKSHLSEDSDFEEAEVEM